MNITDAVRRHGNDERIFLRDYLNGVDLSERSSKSSRISPGSEISVSIAGRAVDTNATRDPGRPHRRAKPLKMVHLFDVGAGFILALN